MRTLISLILVLLGTFSLYQFSVRTTLPQEINSTIDYKARPALSDLGANYPVNGLLAAGALWGIGLGLFLALSTAPKFQSAGEGGLYKKSRRPGAIARIFLLNGALAGTMIDLAYVGAVYAPASSGEAATQFVGLFFGAAALQLAVGLLLFILALCEKQKGKWSLFLGTLIYLAALASWIMTFVWGK
jgi:hypothetical protein